MWNKVYIFAIRCIVSSEFYKEAIIIWDKIARISCWIHSCPLSSRLLTTRFVTNIFDKLTYSSGVKFEFPFYVIRDLLDSHELLSNINVKRKSNFFYVSLWPLRVIANAKKGSNCNVRFSFCRALLWWPWPLFTTLHNKLLWADTVTYISTLPVSDQLGVKRTQNCIKIH